MLARMDGRPVRLRGDWYRIGEVMAWAEKEYGLTPVARAGPRGTAGRRATRAEHEKAAREHARVGRAGQPAPARDQLRRHVEAAAAAARTEAEFFGQLAARGVQVRLRNSTARPGEVTGYAVGLQADITGTGGGPVWFGGGRLAPDLTLPRLRARWAGRPGGPDRLTGQAMSDPAARAVLAREALRAARAARTEAEFFGQLSRAGLLVSLLDPDRPGPAAGYSLSLPGLADRAGQPVWYSGGQLDGQLGLGQLRARWAAGRPGAAPGPDLFDGASAYQIYAHAAVAAGRAAAELRAARGGRRADIAWAAADLITAAAQATGSAELRQAANGFRRAARAPWGRAPAPSPSAAILRTAAYLLAGCASVDRRAAVRRALIAALAVLAGAVTQMRQNQMRKEQAARIREEQARRARDPGGGERKDQQRSLQFEAARQAARGLAQTGGPTWGADPAAVAAAAANLAAPRSRSARTVPAARRRTAQPG